MANLGALTCVPLELSLARSGSVYVVWYVAYIFSKAQEAGEGWLVGTAMAACAAETGFISSETWEEGFLGLGAQTSRFSVEIGRMKKTVHESSLSLQYSCMQQLASPTEQLIPPTRQQLSFPSAGSRRRGLEKLFPLAFLRSLASALVTGWPAHPPTDHPSSKLEGEGKKVFIPFFRFRFFFFFYM